MSTRFLAGGLIVAALVISGCARTTGGGASPGGPDATGPGSAGSPAEVPATGPVHGPPPLTGAAVPALPEPSPKEPVAGSRARTAAWTLAGTAQGGRVLLLDVTVGGPPCELVTGIDVVESTGTVRITVYAGVPAGVSCGPAVPGILATERVPVHLARPLGTRTLTGVG